MKVIKNIIFLSIFLNFCFSLEKLSWELISESLPGFPSDPLSKVAIHEDSISEIIFQVLTLPNQAQDTGLIAGVAYIQIISTFGFASPVFISPSSLSNLSLFGFSVDVNENFLAVGAPGQLINGRPDGAVFIFRRQSLVDTNFQNTFTTIDAPVLNNLTQNFGRAIALDPPNNGIFISTTSSEIGLVYYYQNIGSNSWDLLFTIQPPDITESQFGFSLSVDRDFLIIGTNSETVHFYERYNQTNWNIVQSISTPNTNMDDNFGEKVQIDFDTNTAIISAPNTGFDGAPRSGAVYVFERVVDDDVSEWILSQNITSSVQMIGDTFGEEIDLQGFSLIISNGQNRVESWIRDGPVFNFLSTISSPIANKIFHISLASPDLLALSGSSSSNSLSVSSNFRLILSANDFDKYENGNGKSLTAAIVLGLFCGIWVVGLFLVGLIPCIMQKVIKH